MDTLFNIESLEIFQNVLEQIVSDLYKTDQTVIHQIQPDIIDRVKEDIKILIINNNFDIEKIKESLLNKGWKEDKICCLVLVLEKRWTYLAYLTFIHHNSAYGKAILSFDWLVKIILGINELTTLKYPLLQLMVSFLGSNGEQKSKIYDVNKDALIKIITALENYEDDPL